MTQKKKKIMKYVNRIDTTDNYENKYVEHDDGGSENLQL